MPFPQQRTKVLRDTLIAVLLLCAASEFVIRGPLRFSPAENFNDFISPYVQTREWMRGQDPYSVQNLVQTWPPDAEKFFFQSRDLAGGALVLKRGIPTAYPPTTFVLLTPIAILPWRIAHWLWLAITVLSVIVSVVALLSAADLLDKRIQTLVFVTIALALAPFHTALATGNIVCVAIACSAGGVWAATRRHDIFAGVLFAAAVALKPQIGLPFLFYYLLLRRWQIPIAATASFAALLIVALLRFAAGGAPWLQNYLSDNRILFAPGSLGDFTEGNPTRFGLINFQVPAYALLHLRTAANMTAFALAAAAGVVWIYLLAKNIKNGSRTFLALSTVAVISLLPVYHRFYDATLLIFPLAWSLAEWSGPLRKAARSVFLVIVLVFLIPGGSALVEAQHAGYFAALSDQWWWNALVLPHESWSILLLAVLLLSAMQKARKLPPQAV